MAFQKGIWNQLPSNCNRSYGVTFLRCAAYGTQWFTMCIAWTVNVTQQCISWATNTTQQCTSWANQLSQHCCTWAPCSWFCRILVTIVTVVCVVITVIVTLVCLAFSVVATLVCAATTIVVYVFCALWSFVSIIFCISKADGGTAFLLTDGTVMMQESQSGYGTRRWWKLTPDITGSYINGKWSALASSHIGRTYYASAVLADGRVLVCGGEYSDASGTFQQDETNTCEIYDPVSDSWAVVQ